MIIISENVIIVNIWYLYVSLLKYYSFYSLYLRLDIRCFWGVKCLKLLGIIKC